MFELPRLPIKKIEYKIRRKWTKKLNLLGVESIGQFVMMDDGLIKKLMNINGLKAKMEILGTYCHHVKKIPKLKKSIASTRSFGQDIESLEQIEEAMYYYIKSGVKKLRDNEVSPNRATIFLCGNIHKGEKHYESEQITFQRQTRDVDEIWSQIYSSLKKMYSPQKKYKKCGIIFNNLMPEMLEQGKLFTSTVQLIQPPVNKEKHWEMKQDFITQKYTTSWSDIPSVFI